MDLRDASDLSAALYTLLTNRWPAPPMGSNPPRAIRELQQWVSTVIDETWWRRSYALGCVSGVLGTLSKLKELWMHKSTIRYWSNHIESIWFATALFFNTTTTRSKGWPWVSLFSVFWTLMFCLFKWSILVLVCCPVLYIFCSFPSSP